MQLFLLQLFIFLAAAAIAVPVAKKLGLGSVLGYLVAGIIIGPFGASLIQDVEDIMHFTEFGVVMMLFLVGLELRPSLLWKMRFPILGVGGTQVLLTAAIFTSACLYFLPWQQALAIGLILSLSSTAIILQTLQEKGLIGTGVGNTIFSVLLFQDLAVIPMLAALPLLGAAVIAEGHHHEAALIDISSLPAYLRALVTAGAVSFILITGKYACGPVFREIAATRLREVFVAAALSLVIGTSVLMLAVGLSPALGAFLAGVVLSGSEFRHELESDIEPFKGLLLGIFFISIGASLNFSLIGKHFIFISLTVIALMLSKWLILLLISKVFRIAKADRSLFAVALAQGGEFAFILFQLAKSNGVLPSSIIELLISSVAISMFLTPVAFILHEKFVTKEPEEKPIQAHDPITQNGQKVILAGFGRLGTDVGRFLLSAGIKPIIIDHDVNNVNILRKFGFEVYYGDITRLDLLESAGANEAELLIVAIGAAKNSTKLIQVAKKHFPHLKIVANAIDRETAFEMMDLGLDNIHRELFGSALELGQAAMRELGIDPYKAHRLALIFKKKDQEMMPELYALRGEEDSYISNYQQYHENLEKLMELDSSRNCDSIDKAWTAKNPKA